MPYRDLRDYIDVLNGRGLLHVVDETVCKDTELVPLVRLQFRGLPEEQRKAFWFRKVTDARGRSFDGSVVLGALGSSRSVYGAALGVEPDRIAAAWARAHGNHLPPRAIAREDAPVKEIVLRAPDLNGGADRFPHLISTPGFDPAPFITAGGILGACFAAAATVVWFTNSLQPRGSHRRICGSAEKLSRVPG